jgi:hypothetical protein
MASRQPNDEFDRRAITIRVKETAERVFVRLIAEHGYPADAVASGLVRAAIDIAIRELTFAEVSEFLAVEIQNHLLNVCVGVVDGEIS